MLYISWDYLIIRKKLFANGDIKNPVFNHSSPSRHDRSLNHNIVIMCKQFFLELPNLNEMRIANGMSWWYSVLSVVAHFSFLFCWTVSEIMFTYILPYTTTSIPLYLYTLIPLNLYASIPNIYEIWGFQSFAKWTKCKIKHALNLFTFLLQLQFVSFSLLAQIKTH